MDQLFAAWEDCLGYSAFSTTANLVTAWNSNPTLYWDMSSSQGFTTSMQGYSISPSQSFLLSYYNVVYSKSWVQRALGGSSTAWCTNSANFKYLQSWDAQWGIRHLLKNSFAAKQLMAAGPGGPGGGPNKNGPGGPGKKQHGLFKPQPATVTAISTPYETWKGSYLQTGNRTQALSSAMSVACASGEPRTQPNPTPQAMIDMMHMNEDCAAGWCTDPCWKLGYGKRNASSASSTARQNVIDPAFASHQMIIVQTKDSS